MTERTVRDRYAEIRGKLLKWSIDKPDLFGGFGHLLMDVTGTINLNVLEMLFYYSQSDSFKKRMASRYPKFDTDKHPALHHAVELAIRRLTSIELPEASPAFQSAVYQMYLAVQTKTFLSTLKTTVPAFKARKIYWNNAFLKVNRSRDFSIRKIPNARGHRLFRDLKVLLKSDHL